MELSQTKNKYTIQTVRNAIKILRLFTKENPEWSITEIARQLGLDVSNISRLTKSLERENYLQRDPKTKRYRLGYMIISLSGIITTTMEIHKEARPILEELASEVGEATHLGILEGTEIVYLDKVESQQPVRLNSHIGKRNPSYCTGCGKIMLAYQKPSLQEETLKQIEQDGMIKYGQNTVTSKEELLEQIEEIRSQGFAVCLDEFYEGFSIGSPVYDYTEEVIASISVTGRMNRVSMEDIAEFKEKVIASSKELSEKLGYFHFK